MSASALAERGLSSQWKGFGRLEEERGQTKASSLGDAWKGEGDVHKDTAGELAVRLLDDAIDRYLIDVQGRKHSGGEDKHDGLCELRTWACTVGCTGHKVVLVGCNYGRYAHGGLTDAHIQMRYRMDRARQVCQVARRDDLG